MEKKELLEATLGALDRLLKMFLVERYLYLLLTAVSFVLLLYAGYLMISAKNIESEVLIAIFGGSGLVAASSARITWFFNRAFTVVEDLIKKISE
jgi:hypothetical protein